MANDDLPRGPLTEQDTEELWLNGNELGEMFADFVEHVTVSCDDCDSDLEDAIEDSEFAYAFQSVFSPQHVKHLGKQALRLGRLQRTAERSRLARPTPRPQTLEAKVSIHNSRDALGGDLTADQWHALLLEYKRECAYCLNRVGYCIEHVIPLSRGGRTTIGNVVPSCWGCNVRKGTKTADEYLSKKSFDAFEERRVSTLESVICRLKRGAA